MTEGHVFIATSLDGYIARADGGLDWLEVAGTDDDHGYSAFMEDMDGLVMGRGTFETVLGFGDWPYEKPVVVVSRSLAALPPALEGKVRLHRGTPDQVMADLTAEGWARAYIDGGQLITAFLASGLIQRLTLTRIPVLIGGGLPLFGALPHDIALRHVTTRAYDSGLVQSTYEVARS